MDVKLDACMSFLRTENVYSILNFSHVLRDQEFNSLLSPCKSKKKDSENITQNIREKASTNTLGK